jgi:gliding motility-associated-like protein
VVRSDNNLCPVDSATVSITNTGSLTAPAVSSQSTTLCETDAYPTLTGTALNGAAVPAESGVWSSLDGPGLSVSGTIDATIAASSMAAGNTYQFVYTTSNGLCPDKTDTVTIDINAAPTVSLSPTTANSCGLTPYGLSATASNYASISWASDGGGSFSDSDSTLTDFTPPAQNGTTYNLTITAAGVGTCADATASLALTVNAGPTVNAGIEDTICEATSLDLTTRSTIATASGHTGLSWSATPNVGSFDDNTLVNPVYTPPTTTTSGNITLKLSATGNAPCSLVEDEFILTIRENPTVPNFSHETTAICASTTTGVPVDLVDDGSLVESEYVFSWYNANGDVLIAGPSNGNASANLTGLSNGDQVYLQADYITSVCPSNATSSTASTLTIDAEPDVSVASSSAAIVCVNDAFTLSAADAMTTTIDPAYNPTYSGADASGGALTGGTLDLTGSESSAGSFSYVLTATNGLCSDLLSISMLIKDPEVEAIVSAELIDQGEFADVSAIHNSLEIYTYDWSTNPIGMDGDGSISQSMTVSPEATTYYTVIASLTNVDDPSSANCSASASVELQVIEPIQVPDAFTPNGDGINDSLTIIGIETYAGARIEIFNRWGNAVYSMYGGHNYDAVPWDGKLNGKPLPAGIYYYTIELGLSFEESSTSENKQPMSGSFMLIQ